MAKYWPEDPTSTEVDSYCDWARSHADAPSTCTHHIITQLTKNSIAALYDRYPKVLDKFLPEMREALDNRQLGNQTTIMPVKISSLSQRMAELEVVRAAIPVESCLALLCAAAKNGCFDGQELSAKERIDVLKYLVGRVLPDAKSIDTVERNVNLDRVRRTAKDMTGEELRKLSKQELLDLMGADEG